MESDFRYFEYPNKPPTKKLWDSVCFTVLIFLNISAFHVVLILCTLSAKAVKYYLTLFYRHEKFLHVYIMNILSGNS